MSSVFKAKRGHELAGIELLRFVCAAAVLILHYQHFLFVGSFDDKRASTLLMALPFFPIIGQIYEHGRIAVEIFWVISGYIFYWHYSKIIGNGNLGIIEFSTRRFSRLYPLHISTLLLTAALSRIYISMHGEAFIYNGNSLESFILQLFIASHWFHWPPDSFNGPIWSVSAEIPVYYLFFLITRMASKRDVNTVFLPLILSLFIFTSKSQITFLSEDVFLCSAFFFAGGAAQRLSEERFGILIVGVVSVIMVSVTKIGVNVDSKIIVIALSKMLVLCAAKVGMFVTGSFLKVFVPLGNATYSSYLIHFPIQLIIVIIVNILGISRSIFFRPEVFTAYLFIVIGISLAVYRWFEVPVQSWLRHHLSPLASRKPPARA